MAVAHWRSCLRMEETAATIHSAQRSKGSKQEQKQKYWGLRMVNGKGREDEQKHE